MRSEVHDQALVRALRTAGLLSDFDIRFAEALCRIANEPSPQAQLAVAMANRQARAGHTCFSLSEDPRAAIEGADLSVRWPSPQDWKELDASLLLASSKSDSPLVRDEHGRVFLRRYWALEQSVASQLSRRLLDRDTDATDDIERELGELLGSRLTPEQRDAIALSLREPCTLISGGPGTGKTFTVVGTLALYIQNALGRGQAPPKILVMAPTGKAAARLSESLRRNRDLLACSDDVRSAIPTEAVTIHRALGARRRGRGFAYDADRPLSADMVVIDEASMIDLALMDALLKAVPPSAKLVMLGDPDQLSSVEAGSVFADLCDFAGTTGAIPIARLTTVHRYESGSGIARLAEAVRKQSAEEALALLKDKQVEDVHLMSASELPTVQRNAARSLQAVLQSETVELQLEALKANQVLCAHRRGPSGAQSFNVAVLRHLTRLQGFSPGIEPIIIERNDHDLELYNGDVGLLRRDQEAAFFTGAQGQARHVPQALLPQHDLAFAISIHKSQGSEFGEVTVVLPEEDSPLMTRELLYTAITRAKERVHMVSTEASLRRAIERHGRRQSGLEDALTKLR